MKPMRYFFNINGGHTVTISFYCCISSITNALPNTELNPNYL